MKMRHLFLFGLIGLLAELLIGCTGYEKSESQVTYTTLDEGRGFNTIVIPNADPETFRDIGNNYALDKTHVYYEGVVINGADPTSFLVIKEWGWARDNKNIYGATHRIEACDVDTFRFITNDWQVDRKCVYRSGTMVKS
jgi:hypothetical protein